MTELALAPALADRPFHDILTALRAGGRHLRAPIGAVGWRALPVIVLALAILGDSLTTAWGMLSGISEEANPVAAYGMEVVGLAAYLGLAGMLISLLAWPLLLTPRSRVTWVAYAGAMTVLAGKCYIVLGNSQLLLTLHGT